MIQTQRVIVRGAVVGTISFLLGYLFTWILAGTKIGSLFVTGPFGGGVPDWKATLWVFYDSHFVGTRTPEVFGPGGGLWGGGDLIDTVSLLGLEFLYVVPVVVLLVGGVVVAMLVGVNGPREGAIAGTAVAVGYLALVVAGLFPATQGGVAPSPLRAIVVAGVVYPIGLGAIGGAIVGLIGSESTDDRDDRVAH